MTFYQFSLPVILLSLISTSCYTQPEPPCGLNYGAPGDIENIQIAMLHGNQAEVKAAINQARNHRGTALGCPQDNYGPFEPVDISKPALSEVADAWNNLYRYKLASQNFSCPVIGRQFPRIGVGAYYAHMAGYFDDLETLARGADILEACQYSAKYAPEPLVVTPGLYAYYYGQGNDPCQLDPNSVAGSITQAFCQSGTEFCLTYDKGIFSGYTFAVNDVDTVQNQLIGDLGGAGYDQGWAAAFMLESILQQPDPLLKRKYQQSFLLAAEWAVKYPPVYNHNYTAKLIWLLAQAYAWTGREDFKAALIDKLERNLVPGILMDANDDGIVDETNPPVNFSDLALVASRPGRMWDGHNALPWYHSMNAWAMLEAYVAFRDKGDVALAEKYRPYVLAMLDNLADEITTIGISEDKSGAGWTDVPFSLLNGIWKIARFENEAHQNWENGAWAIWNSGAFEIQASRGMNLGLYLLILSDIPYQPLHERQEVLTSLSLDKTNGSPVMYPNPGNNFININLPEGSFEKYKIRIVNNQGRLVLQTSLSQPPYRLNTKELAKGTYVIKVTGKDYVFNGKIMIE